MYVQIIYLFSLQNSWHLYLVLLCFSEVALVTADPHIVEDDLSLQPICGLQSETFPLFLFFTFFCSFFATTYLLEIMSLICLDCWIFFFPVTLFLFSRPKTWRFPGFIFTYFWPLRKKLLLKVRLLLSWYFSLFSLKLVTKDEKRGL